MLSSTGSAGEGGGATGPTGSPGGGPTGERGEKVILGLLVTLVIKVKREIQVTRVKREIWDLLVIRVQKEMHL